MDVDASSRSNPYAPEPLSFGASSGPGTFTFNDLQSIQDLSTPNAISTAGDGAGAAAGGTHAAYEDALLEYSGLNEDAGGFNLTPGNSPMKFKAEPQPDPYAQVPLHEQMQPMSLSEPGVPASQPPSQPGAGAFGAAADGMHGFPPSAAQAPGQMHAHGAMPPAQPPVQAAAGAGAGAGAGGGFAAQQAGASAGVGASAQWMGAAPAAAKAEPDSGPDSFGTAEPPNYRLSREEAIALLNKAGGVTTEAELNEIDPSYLTAEETKKMKRMRRAIRNRESATASRMRRKEYIESLEKRTSELCSENAMLDLSVRHARRGGPEGDPAPVRRSCLDPRC